MDYSKLKKSELIEIVKEMTKELRSISSPGDIGSLLDEYRFKKQEYFLLVTLDGAHQVIEVREITVGLVNRSLAHPREVFRPAIADSAAAIVVAHNHPSGSIEVSTEDKEVTRRLVDAGELIGIPLLDHVIVSKRGTVSLKEEGVF